MLVCSTAFLRPSLAFQPIRSLNQRSSVLRPGVISLCRSTRAGRSAVLPTVKAVLRQDLDSMLDNRIMPPRDPERPTFHVMPRDGWMNDPNGPIFFNGKYHLFYQHVVNSCEWSFGLVWGHAISSDLVHWEHLPPALVPTPGSSDSDGCFSGCCVIDANGQPVILYTGVRLRSNPACGPLPAPEFDLNLPFVEAQLAAVPVEGDVMLQEWMKCEAPIIEHPPAGVPLTGWRDPFVFETGGGGREWGMLIGTGLKGKGGATMVYRSQDLKSGWRFDGLLCESETSETGNMWECPILVQLNKASDNRWKFRGFHSWSSTDSYVPAAGGQDFLDCLLPTSDVVMANPKSMLSYDEVDEADEAGDESHTHLFCVSPDAPTNPVLYWLGRYDANVTRFDLDNAAGPFRLDLGDVMYAPNMMTDDKGRHLFWGWLQERRRVGSYNYSGCLSLPRLLHLRGNKLVQEPAPEIASLRQGESWHSQHLTVYPEDGTPLEVVAGPCLELEVTLQRGQCEAAGVHLKSWRADSEDAAILVDFERSMLEVVFTDGMPVDLLTLPELDPETDGLRRIGGPIDLKHGDGVTLRIFVDSSCVEVYSSTGEVLSTRVYRGHAPAHTSCGIDLVSYGGAAIVDRVTAWEMGSIWNEKPMKAMHPVLQDELAPLTQSPVILEGVTA